ncbi:endonuclease domain-containing protein [Subtercola frigoramans]|uniref:Very-short-patch-repair endonuclease n=1 Tax=Subtercola frigoramans TaxID=120298 RepID=A0ABS2L4R0_9MICO|nr:hypothetical protein [Subtercola frigoramans]MBM7472079.1 very-short-patch-repair endonuclease [Subtercola frigoramans]
MNIADTVASLGGIADLNTLRASGFTAKQTQRAVDLGGLTRIRRGWVAARDAPQNAVRAVRVGGSLSCVSVLGQLGVWCPPDDLLHVRVHRHGNHLASPDDRAEALTEPAAQGVKLHRTHAAHHPPRHWHTDPVDVALMHAITCQPRNYAVALCDSAINLGLADKRSLERIAALIDKRHLHIVRLADPSAQSGLETMARLRLRALRIPYRKQAEIAGVGHVDLLVGERLVLELDGKEWHSSPEAFAEDRRRDLILHERGYFVTRLTYAQAMFDWPRVEAMIVGLVAHGKHNWPRSTAGIARRATEAERNQKWSQARAYEQAHYFWRS